MTISSLGWVRGSTKAYVGKKSISFDGHGHDASQIVSGTLPVTRGGTGATTLEALKSSLGITSTKYQQIGYKRCITSGSDTYHPQYNEYKNPSLVQIPITGVLKDYSEIIFYSRAISHERYGMADLYPAVYFTSQTVTYDSYLHDTKFFASMRLGIDGTDGNDIAWCKSVKLADNIWIRASISADHSNVTTSDTVIDISSYQNVVYAYPYDTHFATIDNYIFAR